MTKQEQTTVLNVIDWCNRRLRDERSCALSEVRPEKHDYVPAIGDVCCKLDFLADWIRLSGQLASR